MQYKNNKTMAARSFQFISDNEFTRGARNMKFCMKIYYGLKHFYKCRREC
jgi:hypothetical protein